MTTSIAAVLTANDRLKQSFDSTLAVGLVAATVVHVCVFTLWPDMQADSWAAAPPEAVETIRLDDFVLPEAPEPLDRPMRPVISDAVSAEETIPVIGFTEYAELPPPPVAPTKEVGGTGVAFTPYTVPPRLKNPAEVQRALERAYPPTLRDAGLGGTVNLLVNIDAQGMVLDARVGESSGYPALDDAAMGLSEILEFSPAMNRDVFVAVWIQIPLTFRVR